MWEQVKHNISAFFDMPVVRNVITITYIIIGIFLVMSRTSIGRKILLGLKSQYDNMKKEHVEIVEMKNREIAEIKADFDAREREFKQDCENKIAVVTFKANQVVKSMAELLSLVPNVKVQEGAAQIIKDFDESIVGISDLVDFEVKKANAAANMRIDEIEAKLNLLLEGDKDGKEE